MSTPNVLTPAMQAFLDETMTRNAALYGKTRMAFLGAAGTEPATETATEAPAPDAAPAETPTEAAMPTEEEPSEAPAEDADKVDDVTGLTQAETDALADEVATEIANEQTDPPLGEAGQRAYERVKGEKAALKTEVESLRAEIEALKTAKPAEAPAAKPAKADAAASSPELEEIRAMLAESKAAAADEALTAAATALGFSNLKTVAKLIDVPFKGMKVDREALGHALDDLAADNPGLLKPAAPARPKAKGPAGGGQRTATNSTSASQLTFEEAARLSPEALAKAFADNRLVEAYKHR